jgi:hypothetical protein
MPLSTWYRSVRSWLGAVPDDALRPRSRGDEFARTELLEHRLVLGSLSIAAADGGSISSTDSQASTPAVGEPAVSPSFAVSPHLATINLPASPELSSAPPSRLVIENSPTVTEQTDSAHPFLEHDSTATSLSDDETQVLPALSTSANASSDAVDFLTQSALATDTQDPTAGAPVRPESLPGDVDASLVAVNQQVFVTEEELASAASATSVVPAWFDQHGTSAVIRYDFRDTGSAANLISAEQIDTAESILRAWSEASGGRVQFVRDANAPLDQIVNLGIGDLAAVGRSSATGDALGTAQISFREINGEPTSVGTVWLDAAETWSDGSVAGSNEVDFSTVIAHEIGHVLGLADDHSSTGIMNPNYAGAVDPSALAAAWADPTFFTSDSFDVNGFVTDDMLMGYPQLSQDEVATLLQRAALATPSNDAIIVIVDRNGTILGVRAEQDVLDNLTDPAVLSFAIDGAVSKARTAAFFANDTAPLTSRTVRNMSQSTILQR